MLNLVIFGAPGSGKGTQADQLAVRYNLRHLSTGEIFRKEIAQGTPLGLEAMSHIDIGELVPDELTVKLVAEQIRLFKKGGGVILDGFPRNIVQAESLAKLLASENLKLHAALFLEVPEEELIKRLLLRGQNSGRSDDNEEVIKKRLLTYNKQTAPLIEYYKKHELFIGIDGVGDINKIFGAICHEIDELPR